MRKWIRIVLLTAGPSFFLFLLWGVSADTDVPLPPGGLFPGSAPVGLLFLPGGLVDPQAYTPLAQAISRQGGFPVRILPLPFRSAMTDGLRVELFAEIEKQARSGRWVLAGHSRGAALATRFAHEHPDPLAGLVLLGTTHPRDYNLSSLRIPVLKISGTNDRIASLADSERNRPLLPPHTRWLVIPGGNHRQFAAYRFQLGDGAATISRDEQQRQTATKILELLESLR